MAVILIFDQTQAALSPYKHTGQGHCVDGGGGGKIKKRLKNQDDVCMIEGPFLFSHVPQV